VARIVVGAMGDSLGHINHALAVVQAMPHHEFLFLGGEKVLDLRKMGYRVEEIPVPGTHYSNNRVDIVATASNGARVLFGRRQAVKRVVEIVKEFDPSVILTAYEFFTPLAARSLGIPCISIDNQHFLTKCVYTAPKGQSLSRLMFALPLRYMYSNADLYLINTFFPLVPANPADTEVFPPLLMPAVKQVTPTEGDYVLVYQTSPTFARLIPALEKMPTRFVIYGFGERNSSKRIVYRAPSRERFVEELAGCRYVIANGGHNVIAEALYFGKPVFSFPIHYAYEQFFNAYMLASMGYGEYSMAANPGLGVLERFETHLDEFRGKIRQGEFYGNEKLAARLDEIIKDQQKRDSYERSRG
jgi:uncharacterized protein (TIGR00661 family)